MSKLDGSFYTGGNEAGYNSFSLSGSRKSGPRIRSRHDSGYGKYTEQETTIKCNPVFNEGRDTVRNIIAKLALNAHTHTATGSGLVNCNCDCDTDSDNDSDNGC